MTARIGRPLAASAALAAFAVALLLAAAAPARAETEVRALLEPEVLGVDEVAVFSIEVRGGGFSRPRVDPSFELHNLEVVGGPSVVENIQYGGGKLSRSYRVSWQLRPREAGPARVHSILVSLNRAELRLGSREVTVQEASVGRASGRRDRDREPADPLGYLFGRPGSTWRREPGSRPPRVFLRAEVEPQRPWAGEQALYTVSLYTLDDITAVTPREIPDFSGFWVHDVEQPRDLPSRMVEIDGRRYARVVVLQKALFPLRPGRVTIEPVAMDVIAREFERRFFAPPISRSEVLALKTAPVALDVRELPEAPAGFGGAVGRLGLTAHLEPEKVRLGEAATLTLTLSGEGNLQGVRDPRVAAPPGVELLSPEQGSEERMADATLRGRRTWSFPVIPRRAGRFDLELPEVPYFDPGSGTYRTAAAPPLALLALPAEGAAEPHGIRSAAFGREERPDLARRALPWLFALPWGIGALILLARRAAANGALAGSPGSRRRGTGAALPAGLDERLREAANDPHPRQAASGFEEVWRELLAERWGVPAALPPSRWRAALAERGLPAEALSEIQGLADDLHFLRNAPQLSDTGALRQEVAERSRRLLRRLR